MKPLISITILTYNSSKYIKRALDSALLQNYRDFEIIIMDGGSKDDTKKIIDPYLKDSRVRYYEGSGGISKLRNKSIKISCGKYIAILDSDDWWPDSSKLLKQANFLENNQDYVAAGGGIIRLNEHGEELSKILNPEKDEDIKKNILFFSPFASSSVMFRRDAFEKAGGFEEKTDFSEDWDLWLRMGKIGKLYNFQEYFLCYLQWPQNVSNKNVSARRIRNLRLVFKYRKDYQGFKKSLLLHLFYFAYFSFPFLKMFSPLLLKIKMIIFGRPVYRKN